MLSSVGIVGLVEAAGVVNPLLGEIRCDVELVGRLAQVAMYARDALHAWREVVFVGLRCNQGRDRFDGELMLYDLGE
jgi:hypothetical protein